MDFNIDNIIRPGDDPLAEEPTYTITLSVTQALAVRDAVTCLWVAAGQGSADDAYGEYGTCGFLEQAHEVADVLTDMMRPYTARVGQHIRMLSEGYERRN